MRQVFLAALLATTGGFAFAQTAAPPANTNPPKPAVAAHPENNASMPAAGANSFTESQAKARLEGAGYTGVTGLAKDKDGVWRGKGAKGGTSVDVSLDYQGNILPK